jgi:hypothetical protein
MRRKLFLTGINAFVIIFILFLHRISFGIEPNLNSHLAGLQVLSRWQKNSDFKNDEVVIVRFKVLIPLEEIEIVLNDIKTKNKICVKRNISQGGRQEVTLTANDGIEELRHYDVQVFAYVLGSNEAIYTSPFFKITTGKYQKNAPKRTDWDSAKLEFEKFKEKYLDLTLEGPLSEKKKIIGKGLSLGYRIQVFDENQHDKVLFTTGAQACTAIAGFDPISRVGFIGHFNYLDVNTEKAIQEIAQVLKELTGNERGLKDMKLYVVGGVPENIKSQTNLVFLYRELVEKYGVKYEQIEKYNSGLSFSIAVVNGKIVVTKWGGRWGRNFGDYFKEDETLIQR